MKQYKITFFKNNKNPGTSIHYREFETIKELKAWAYDFLSECSQYCRFEYKEVSVNEFLANI